MQIWLQKMSQNHKEAANLTSQLSCWVRRSPLARGTEGGGGGGGGGGGDIHRHLGWKKIDQRKCLETYILFFHWKKNMHKDS